MHNAFCIQSTMDYTEYRFSYEREKGKKRREKIGGKGEKKGTLGVAIVCVIFIAFLGSLFLSTRLVGRDIIKEISSVIGGENKVRYYVVCLEKTEFLSDANAYAKKVRSSGGAGYVFGENGGYSVALATYIDEKDALEVVGKNDRTEIKEIVFDLKGYLDGVTDDGLTKRALTTLFESISILTEVGFSYDERTLTFDVAERRTEGVKNGLLAIKMELTEKGAKSGDELVYFIDPLLAVCGDFSEENLTKNLRYGVCETLDRLGSKK